MQQVDTLTGETMYSAYFHMCHGIMNAHRQFLNYSNERYEYKVSKFAEELVNLF